LERGRDTWGTTDKQGREKRARGGCA